MTPLPIQTFFVAKLDPNEGATFDVTIPGQPDPGIIDNKLFGDNARAAFGNFAYYAEMRPTPTLNSITVRVDRPDSRCVIVNVDPDRGRPDAPMLKIIGRHHDARGDLPRAFGS